MTNSPLARGPCLTWLLGIALVAPLPMIAPDAWAQSPGGPTHASGTPSPVAPGDLSKPVFDTTTRIYGPIQSLDKSADTVVAEIEGRPLVLGNVSDAIASLPFGLRQLPFETLYSAVLEQLITQQALVVRAQQQGLDEDAVVRRKVREASDTALADSYLNHEIGQSITEEALLARYNRDVAGRPGPEEVRARVITTATEKEAQALIGEIRGGGDFATVARRDSKDTTAGAGGDLGFVTRDGLTPEVGAVAFALALGQMASYPVSSAKAWFVVKTEERRLQPAPGFAAVRERLVRDMLHEGLQSVTDAAMKGLKLRRYSVSGKESDVEKPDTR